MKPVYWILLLLIMLSVWIVWEWPIEKPELIMCDVGQGDSMLITQGFVQMVVDTGNEPDKLLRCLSQYLPFWDRQLELVVLTHPEIDHMGAFAEIMQAYAVKKLLVSPIGNDTQEFKHIYQNISKSSITVITAQQGQMMQLGSVSFSVLWPLPQADSIWEKNYAYEYQNISSAPYEQKKLLDAENPNESSIVLAINIEGVKVLLTGDISTQVELALIDRGLIEDIDILKVAHHGSKTSSQDLFLDKAKPELALISVGSDNRYGHPHPTVVSRLQERNVLTKRTDKEGNIQLFLQEGKIYSEKYPWMPDWLSLSLDQIKNLK